MAWNGRNESILGSKPGTVDVVAPPTEVTARRRGDAADDVGNVAKFWTTTITTSSTEVVTSHPPPSAPPVNAWNGRNATIIRAKDETGPAGGTAAFPAIITPSATTTTPGLDAGGRDETGDEPVAVVVVVGHPGPSPPSTSPLSAEEDVVVGATGRYPRSRRRKDQHQQAQQHQQERRRSKEDEATNSTAGSTAGSTAASFSGAVGGDGNGAPEDDASPPPLLEGNTVVTMNATTTAVKDVESSSAPAASRPDHHPTEGRKKRDVGNNKKKGKSLPSSSPAVIGDSVIASASARGSLDDPNGTGKNGRGDGDNGIHRKNSTSSAADNATSGNNGGRRSGGGGGINSNGRGANRGGNGGNVGNGGQQQRQSGKGHAVPPPSSRGNKKGADGVEAGGRPICSFHARGMCNRGASCAFRHDSPRTHADAVTPTYPIVGHRGNDVDRSANVTATPLHARPRREFDPHKAKAIQLAKEAQDHEDRTAFFASAAKMVGGEAVGSAENSEGEEKKADENGLDPQIFSIDVECIATGYGSCARGINDGVGNAGRNGEGVPPDQYNDNSHRYPGRVALVDSDGNVHADILIRPPGDGAGVVSYLTPLTGLTAEVCLGPDSVPLDDAVRAIRALLPPNSVIVGQAIGHDVTWLGLRSGTDYDRTLDISDIFRQRMPAVLAQAAGVVRKRAENEGDEEGGLSSSCDRSSDEFLGFATRYRCFSLRHVCLNLLGEDIQKGVHDPVTDAKYSLMLFHKYRNSSPTQLRIVRDGLHRAPITPGFAAEKTPLIDGVCVSALGYPYKRAARKIWRWYSSVNSSSAAAAREL
jgi:hypothetical protein